MPRTKYNLEGGNFTELFSIMTRAKLSFAFNDSMKEIMKMKKIGLFAVAVLGFGLAAVGCTSQETVESPETAQVTSATEASVTTEQSGAVVQADPSAQGAEVQSAPAPQPTVQQ